MKKLFILLSVLICLAIGSPASAICLIGSGTTTATCVVCEDGLIFAWYANSVTVGDTGFSPCGCSAGDTSATAVSEVTISGGAINIVDGSDDGGDYYSFDIASIWLEPQGSMVVEADIDVWSVGGSLVSIYVDASNSFRLRAINANDLQVYWKGTGTATAVITSDDTADQVATGTKYWIVVRWDEAAVDPNLGIWVYNAAEAEVVSDTDNTDIRDWQAAPSGEAFNVGNPWAALNHEGQIYSVRVWDTYAGAPSSGF